MKHESDQTADFVEPGNSILDITKMSADELRNKRFYYLKD